VANVGYRVSLDSDGNMDKLKSWGEAITDRVNTQEGCLAHGEHLEKQN
jgi:sulfur relay (sulfurtransferase) DsrC/TusE family protein